MAFWRLVDRMAISMTNAPSAKNIGSMKLRSNIKRGVIKCSAKVRIFCEMCKKNDGILKKGNYIRVDSDFIFTTISVNFDVNYRQFKYFFCLSRKNARAHWQLKTKRRSITIGVNKYINP